MAAESKPEKSRVRKHLTQDRLKEFLHYDSGTGVFTWIRPTNRRIARVRIGDPAGCVCANTWGGFYRHIGIETVRYPAHRLAWLYMHGTLAEGQDIDHRDGDGLNNAIINLRACSRSENLQNRRIGSHNKSGFKGVTWHAGARRWRAVIKGRDKQIHLGFFDKAEDAHAAYVKAAQKLYGEFANPG